MEKGNIGPKYKQIKEDIVDDILSGVYRPGDMIPKQSDYARTYNVSRLTVRKAIDDLVLKGVLVTEKGKGTFVQPIAAGSNCYRRSLGFSSNMNQARTKVWSKVLVIEEMKADKTLAFHLQIAVGDPVVHIERLRYINNVCAALQKSYLARERVGGICFEEEQLEQNSLYQLLFEKAGLVLSYVDEQFRAIRAERDVAESFQVEEGDPVLYVHRITYDVHDRPIEYCKNYESSDVNGIWVKSISIT